MLLTESLLGTSSVAANYIEDVFSTYLYDGNSSTQTITNGIDLSTKGGLVWLKSRNINFDHQLYDTVRGTGKVLYSNLTNAQSTVGTGLTAFSTNGFTLGSGNANTSTVTYTSWTFRKQAKFFDVVTYTGNGANRTIAHNLGAVPGCIMVKRTDTTTDWQVYHRSLANTQYAVLNSTAAAATGGTRWNSTTPTSTEFSLGTATNVNGNGGTYVAYLFAHDAGGFGTTGADNVISCGSFTTDGSGNATVSLGYEPQWILIKLSSGVENWEIFDNMRGFFVDKTGKRLRPSLSEAESDSGECQITNTGFKRVGVGPNGTYVYIAIRRGPMKTPTSGTSVFSPNTYTGDGATNRLISSGFPADFAYIRDRNDGTIDYRQNYVQDRLRGGGRSLVTNSTGIEGSDTGWINSDMANEFQSNSGILVTPYFSRFNASSKSYVSYQFRRAPGFFDVVCYTGTGANRTLNHNLGVAPELIIVKDRITAQDWEVYSAAIGATKALRLNQTPAAFTASTYWNNTAPTSSVFTVGTSGDVNANGDTYVAYLFATCPGVSKVGSYTGTGTTKQIDCGFTGGARFVLIRRTDAQGEWYFWDSARGIVAGNDPYLRFNTASTEVTNTDYIDTYSAGFEISSTADVEINASGGSFIFLAIA